MMELWPFTNFHDLNLDWIVRTIKVYTKKVDDLINTGLYDYVEEVLTAHPEWTTTVMDGAISTAKLMDDAVTREKLANGIDDYLDDIEYQQDKFDLWSGGRTTIYWAVIPSTYRPKLSLAHDMLNAVENHAENANRNHATVSVNAGVFRMANNETRGYIVADGLLVGGNAYQSGETDAAYIYMDKNGVLGSVADTTAINTIIANYDPEWMVHGFYPLVINGQWMAQGHTDDSFDPRTWIAQDANGNYLVGVCGGRENDESGMKLRDIYEWCLNDAAFSPEFLYNLDGGGSSSIIYNSVRTNMIVGEDRPCANYIQFVKDDAKIENTFKEGVATSKGLAALSRYVYNRVGEKVQIDKLLPLITHDYATNDCDEVVNTGFYTVNVSTANSPFPSGETGVLVALHDNAATTVQLAINQSRMFTRQIYQGTTSAWRAYPSRRSPETVYTSTSTILTGTIRSFHFGDVYQLTFDGGLTAAVSNGEVVKTGLPAPATETVFTVEAADGTMLRMSIDTSGTLKCVANYSAGGYTKYVKGSCTYMGA